MFSLLSIKTCCITFLLKEYLTNHLVFKEILPITHKEGARKDAGGADAEDHADDDAGRGDEAGGGDEHEEELRPELGRVAGGVVSHVVAHDACGDNGAYLETK